VPAGSLRKRPRITIDSALNLAFRDWGTVFPSGAGVTALIDRLTHHAEIITITGESYRRREAAAAQKNRRSTA